MNTQIARAFVINRLNDGQVQHLHHLEKGQGFCLPPAAIHERFHTLEWGDVTEEAQNLVGRPVMAIYNRIRGQHVARARAGADISEMAMTHEVDLEIRRQGIRFDSGKGSGSVRERIMGGRKPAAAGYEP